MKCTLISPNIVTQKGDFFGSGIPYMPFTLAYAAAQLREHGHTVFVIDAFGASPTSVTIRNGSFIQGLSCEQVVARITQDTDLIILSAERVISHDALLLIIDAIKKNTVLASVPLCIIENTQAVSAYSLQQVADAFFSCGVDYLLTGEPEERLLALIAALSHKGKEKNHALLQIDGLMFFDTEHKKHSFVDKKNYLSSLDSLPFPAWDLFPIENYWDLGYAHAPLTSQKYLPLLTSRGCPYPCGFCVVPSTNQRRWRFRSAKNVVDEMQFFFEKYSVSEFHLEDLNPTIQKQRMKDISSQILSRKLPITWKIGSGTKIETVDFETLTIMAQAGCTFVSFSPESGNPEMLKKMNKPFDHALALKLVAHMHTLSVTTQACFVLGYPEETAYDREMTYSYIADLAKAGCDEVALFLMAPVPGASTYAMYKETLEKEGKKISLQEMSFSPKWRSDYSFYKWMRFRAYILFTFVKFFYHPVKTLKQPIYFLTGKFQTKMEMTVYRLVKTYLSFLQNYFLSSSRLIVFWLILVFLSYYIVRALDVLHYLGISLW